MSFADLEDRVNAATMRKLSNARALQVGASEDFPVIFDRQWGETGTGASVQRPVATALDADVAAFEAHSTQVTIRSVTYTVTDLQPDGAGFTELVLQEA